LIVKTNPAEWLDSERVVRKDLKAQRNKNREHESSKTLTFLPKPRRDLLIETVPRSPDASPRTPQVICPHLKINLVQNYSMRGMVKAEGK